MCEEAEWCLTFPLQAAVDRFLHYQRTASAAEGPPALPLTSFVFWLRKFFSVFSPLEAND